LELLDAGYFWKSPRALVGFGWDLSEATTPVFKILYAGEKGQSICSGLIRVGFAIVAIYYLHFRLKQSLIHFAAILNIQGSERWRLGYDDLLFPSLLVKQNDVKIEHV
jgi:hypothetical protein